MISGHSGDVQPRSFSLVVNSSLARIGLAVGVNLGSAVRHIVTTDNDVARRIERLED
jgi:hypothetical protein